jgi:membrane fusion protein (multidrug efflux system)
MATADTTQTAENTPGNPNSGKRKFMLLILAVAVALSGAGVWAYHEFTVAGAKAPTTPT